MNELNKDTECLECHKRMFLFSLKGVNGDMTISIPAEDESMAYSVLDDIVAKPDDWIREEKLENDLQGKYTGKRKPGAKPWNPPATDSGPMFG